MATMDEEAIIERCREGDLAAFRRLYERYEQPLLRTASRLLGRRQDAEDAVQETFIKLYRRIDLFQSGSKFSTYLFRILINTCTDILRKRTPETALDPDREDPGARSGHELRFSLEEAILSLPDRMRACFVLFAVEELDQAEIARILEISVGAVKAHVHRARIRLRDWFSFSREEAAT
jgi:RNA polymerase sigma-70 factor (ECF subfamily)